VTEELETVPTQEKAVWQTPRISRLVAGKAELLTGPASDGPDFS
jgi:hypothetical protein